MVRVRLWVASAVRAPHTTSTSLDHTKLAETPVSGK